MNLNADLAATCQRLTRERGGTIVSAAPTRPPEPADEFKDEKAFQAAVVEEAERRGWTTYHPWLSVRSKSGYFDLTMIRDNRVIFAELKTETGVASAPQLDWGEAAAKVGGNVSYFLWRPSDWVAIMEELAK